MVTSMTDCHGNISLGASSCGSDVIIDLLYVSVDQYWTTL